MNNIMLILLSNLFVLVVATLFKLTLTEVYACLSFNLILFLFVGLVNLTAHVQKNLSKGELDDTRGNASES